jgi:hypothetical protein
MPLKMQQCCKPPKRGQKQPLNNKSTETFGNSVSLSFLCIMNSTKQAKGAQGATLANMSQTDLLALVQQMIAMQAQPVSVPIVGAEVKGASVKSKAKKAPAKGLTIGKAHPLDGVLLAVSKTAKPAKQASEPAKPVQIVKLANSFFVIGEQAPAKLAPFFARKPHLDRGFKEREIAGIGKVKAFWFGARQLAKIERLLAAK